jgi:hypothetical protein
MTETTLKIENIMDLCPDLRYTKYNTEVVKNIVEMQTLEKSYKPYNASSKDASSVTWNLTSLSGGHILRELELEIPLKFSITYRGIGPSFAMYQANPVTGIPIGGVVSTIVLGTTPRPFITELNCLDSSPLSKMFGTREYTINSASTVLKENYSSEQICIMESQLDMVKCENSGLCMFLDSNSHFRTLNYATGGMALQYDALSTFIDQTITPNADYRKTRSLIPTYYLNPVCKFAAGICDSWQSKRNSARNIVKSTMTARLTSNGTNVPTSIKDGYGSNQMPTGDEAFSNDVTFDFEIVVREQLLSNYWMNDLAYDKFGYNRLMPCSSLNVKFGINTKYMKESILKISDNVASMLTGFATSQGKYIVSVPTIGDTKDCKLYISQCKVPIALLPNDAYKVLYYSQTRPSAAEPVVYTESFGVKKWAADMKYNNLSRIPDYLIIYMPIDKASLRSNLPSVAANSIAYQLPSMLNAPISQLNITFGQDTNIATYSLDRYKLEQFTLENIQNNEKLQSLIVGERKDVQIGYNNVGFEYTNTTAAPLNSETLIDNFLVNSYKSTFGSNSLSKNCSKTNGISNSSFYILNTTTQLRLPDGYTAEMIVAHNLEVSAEFNALSPVFRQQKDAINDIGEFAENGTVENTNIKMSLEVIHVNKQLFTISGQANQEIYIHDIQIQASEYLAIRNEYQASFSKLSKDDIFTANAMIGGGFMSNLKRKTGAAYKWLSKRIEKKGGEDKEEDPSKFGDTTDDGFAPKGGSYGNPHAIEAGKKGRKAPAKSTADWRSYM